MQFHRDASFEDRLNRKGLETSGERRWRRAVHEATRVLKAAFLADYVVLGGGNAKHLDRIPSGCRRGGNHNAYFGGIKMWDRDTAAPPCVADESARSQTA